MKTINVKAGSLLGSGQPNNNDLFPEERAPCLYANLERADKKKDYQWTVGCKYDGNVEEHSFKISKVRNVNNVSEWAEATSEDFAIELIRQFRMGGITAIKKWVSQKCPLSK